MKIQRFLIALTILNLVLLLRLLFQPLPTMAQSVAPVLRGRALEIVDEQGRVGASITVLPASIEPKEPFPDTVILRLSTRREACGETRRLRAGFSAWPPRRL